MSSFLPIAILHQLFVNRVALSLCAFSLAVVFASSADAQNISVSRLDLEFAITDYCWIEYDAVACDFEAIASAIEGSIEQQVHEYLEEARRYDPYDR